MSADRIEAAEACAAALVNAALTIQRTMGETRRACQDGYAAALANLAEAWGLPADDIRETVTTTMAEELAHYEIMIRRNRAAEARPYRMAWERTITDYLLTTTA